MEDCHLVNTLMVTRYKLSNDNECPNVNQKYYRSMVGSFLYVTTTRPDIMQAVGYVAWCQATPKDTRASSKEDL